MPRLLRPIVTCFTLFFAASAAIAEITAEDVWADWQSYINGFGYSVDGEVERSAGALTVTGVTVATLNDTGTGGANIRMDRIVMTEQSDGTVAIALPTVMPVELSAMNPNGGLTRISLDYRHDGLTILASGMPEALRYDYAADAITLETTGLEVDGEIMPPETNVVEITLEDIIGQTDMTLDSQRRYDQSLQAASLRYSLQATTADTGASSDISGQMQALRFTGESALPLREVDPADMDAMLAAGFVANGTFTYAANAMTLAVMNPSEPSESSLISGPGTFTVRMDQGGLTYDLAQQDLAVEMKSEQFPLPLSFNVGQSSFNLAMPLRKSETADDFAFGFKLDQFAMSDMLWGLFDPAAELPRDPATVALDLVGKARLLFNFLDPSEAATLGPEDVPAEIESVDIRTLRIAAVGAELTGKGAFAFENTAEGMPQPKGAVDLTLTGANALIDRLVATGLLPEQQAMGARMMMGLLAVPGEAPDTLNSRIEVNEEGHVLANGQRIQ